MAPEIKQLPYNWSTPRGDHDIEAIIAHGTVGTDSRAYLSRGGEKPDGSDRKVSIHVLIQKPGTPIYRYVPDTIGANHAGFGHMPKGFTQVNPNLTTLGFELENLQNGKDPYTDAQLLVMGWQINEWRRLHGPLPVLRHTDIDPPPRKFDTVGLSVAQIEQWCVKAKAYYAPPTPIPDPLRAEELPGPNKSIIYCSETTAAFYVKKGGFSLFGYPLKDEFSALGTNGALCSILVCERAVIKRPANPLEPVHLALLSEVKAKGWV